ncbi:hypothetical protein F5887DRAFT_1081455 [Amanita rubescens]|nr:hypothetical protein F5887DRAFT_1091592 [Amanita rubescens]KAF8325746.1 hypothetical protein F5887DRAFT_1085119 [Amanita rubescens]KAF8330934.1 hypothetical protein F5887DRAFT_1081455 [Amanita rubescens]
MSTTSNSKPTKQADYWAMLASNLSTDPRLLYLIRSAVRDDNIAAASDYLRFHLKSFGAPPDMTNNHNLLGAFGSFCNRNRDKMPVLEDGIMAAWEHRRKEKDDLDMAHKHLVVELGLNWKAEKQQYTRDLHLEGIKVVELPKLKIPYPPKNHWVVESKDIGDLWFDYIYNRDQPDPRLKRHPFHQLDPAKITLYVDPDTNIIVKDKKTKEIVLVVMRNACRDKGAVLWVDATVTDATKLKKSIRLEDPGSLVQIGYSAGSRSKPSFNWVRNVRSTKTDARDLDQRTCSAFAFFWNLCRGWLPPQIIVDIDRWITKSGLPAMNATRQLGSHKGSYNLIVNGIPFTFSDVHLAPPAGVMARNYARAIHRESQPHDYAISWTTSRNKGQEYGGCFYLAQYGIQVAPAANTIIAWRNRDAHGTGLQKVDPSFVNNDDDPNYFHQAGLAFVTPNRLQKAWDDCLKGIIDESRVWEVIQEGDDEAEIEYNWDDDEDEA